MIDIEDRDRMTTADFLLDMRSHEIHKRRWPVAEYGDSFYFEQMKKMADAINDLEEEAWRQMEEKLILYRQKLAEYKVRSEEHTSELQSRGHLVCRLLLEKKQTYLRWPM